MGDRSLRVLGLVMGRIEKEGIPKKAGDRRIARVKTQTDTPLGEIREVLGVVAPPSAVVVPEVMERVGGRRPDGKDGLVDGGCICAHGCFSGWLKHQDPGQQKSASLIG